MPEVRMRQVRLCHSSLPPGSLIRHLPAALDECDPDVVVYNAGTDILVGDPLGNLDITPEAHKTRFLLMYYTTQCVFDHLSRWPVHESIFHYSTLFYINYIYLVTQHTCIIYACIMRHMYMVHVVQFRLVLHVYVCIGCDGERQTCIY